jgi:hypothetical protein
MTNREFFTAISNNESLSDELRTFATEAIAKLDKRNEDRKGKVSSKKSEFNEPIKQAILEKMEPNTAYTAAVVWTEFGLDLGDKNSVQFVSRMLQELKDEGKVIQSEVSVKGKGKQKGYTLV